jgi:hypothetical protein
MSGLIQRFFGFGGGGGLALGDVQSLGPMGQIQTEFLGELARYSNISYRDTSPEVTIRDEREASEMQARSEVYRARLRANQKKAAAVVGAAKARLSHDVAINGLNGQLVAAQALAQGKHAQIGFKNGMAGAHATGTVQGYTQENNVFGF